MLAKITNICPATILISEKLPRVENTKIPFLVLIVVAFFGNSLFIGIHLS